MQLSCICVFRVSAPRNKTNYQCFSIAKGPSIYDVHTEGEGGQARVDACGRGGPAPCGRPHRKLKLESTDIILSSPHAKKLASFLPKVSSLDRKKWKFFCDINY